MIEYSVREVREYITGLLTTLYGANVAAVYDYMPSSFNNKTPVVVVTTGGRRMHRQTGNFGKEVLLFVTFAVLYSSTTGSTYGPKEAQNTLDDLVDELEVFLKDNRTDALYTTIEFPEISEQFKNEKSNVPYQFEVVPMIVNIE